MAWVGLPRRRTPCSGKRVIADDCWRYRNSEDQVGPHSVCESGSTGASAAARCVFRSRINLRICTVRSGMTGPNPEAVGAAEGKKLGIHSRPSAGADIEQFAAQRCGVQRVGHTGSASLALSQCDLDMVSFHRSIYQEWRARHAGLRRLRRRSAKRQVGAPARHPGPRSTRGGSRGRVRG